MNEYDGRIAALEVRVAQFEQMLQQSVGAGDAGEGGSQDAATRPLDGQPGRAFEYGVVGTDCKFVNCKFQFGRVVHAIEDQTANDDGTYYLVIPHANPGSAVVIMLEDEEESEESDYTVTKIPLITVQDGRITQDYRGMPVVPVYE